MCQHLHNHTGYSILDGYSTIKELVKAAKGLGHKSVAITDHGVMYGVLEFYEAAKKEGIKPIIGVEAYMMPWGMSGSVRERVHGHLLLLAENNKGYHNLCHLVTASQKNYYYQPRLDYTLLETYSEGVIATTGCMAGEIPSLIRDGKLEDAEKVLVNYLRIFGENFYVELQDHGIPELLTQNEVLLDFSKKYGIECIVTNDSHYTKRSDSVAHDISLCIQTGKKVSEVDRMKFDSDDYYLKSDDEMPYKEYHASTNALAEKCNVSLEDTSYKIPFVGNANTLRKMAYEGASLKYKEIPKDRLDYEIGVIDKMGFSSYILMVADIISFAKRNGVFYSVRGSAAGSILCYCLDITKVEPISNGLFFERFLNPSRVSMPDIDMDFASDQRGMIVDYVVDKYGEDKVAQIVTFGTMATKAALKDAARVLGVPIKEVEKLTALVPSGAKATDLSGCESITEYQLLLANDQLKMVHESAKTLEGRVRNAGIHAAGIVVCDRPVENVIPLVKVEKSTLSDKIKYASQFEMGHLEKLGLIKMDFLGLSTLTSMRKAIAEINKKYGKSLTFDNVPLSSDALWSMLAKGDTTGVFQLGSDGMTDVIVKMKPNSYENITAAVALFRPGPMQYIPSYISRMHGKEDVVYSHESLKEILEETYGIICYQEQLMKVAQTFSGFTMAEADTLRKAIGKKDKELLLAQEEKFVGGAVKKGYDENIAKKLWEDILPSARYSFNKAHAAVYAELACKTAWLKAHYPSEFIAAFLDEELNNGRVDSVSPLKAVYKILPPTLKNVDTVADGDAIRIGMTAIKGISQECAMKSFIASDAKTIGEFVRSVNPNKTQLEALVKSGVLDHLYGRAALYESIPAILKWKTSNAKKSIMEVLTGEFEDAPLERHPSVVWDDKDYMEMEMEIFGFYIAMSPEEKVHLKFKSVPMEEVKAGKYVLLAGTYTMRVIDTKKGDKMAFLSLVNKEGKVDVTVFPKQYVANKELLESGNPIQVYGKAQLYNGKLSVLADVISNEDMSDKFPALFEKPKFAGKLYLFSYDGEEELPDIHKMKVFLASFYSKEGLAVNHFDFLSFNSQNLDVSTGVNPYDLLVYLNNFK